MGIHVAVDCPELDAKIDEATRAIGEEINMLAIPRLGGVVLGGGYGRGEGGIWETESGPALSNDLDFYVVTDEGADEDAISEIGRRLKPVSEKWTKRLGVDADFCVAKTPWRIKHDEARLMVQELVRGYFDVAGRKGESLFAHVERRPAQALPWGEAARLLMNRGIGLLLAKDKSVRDRFGFEDARGDFVPRNINKCVLGAGDARLIARRGYCWKALERVKALGDGLYGEAVQWKFRPRADAVCSWEAAREAWLSAADEVMELGRESGGMCRSLREAARWIARSRTIGDFSTLGMDCAVRVLMRVRRAVADGTDIDDALMREWKTFN